MNHAHWLPGLLGMAILALPADAAYAELKMIGAVGCVVGKPAASPADTPLNTAAVEEFADPAFDIEVTVWEWEYRKGELDSSGLSECSTDCETPPPAGADVCRVEYTRHGKTEILWRAKHDPRYCYPRAEAFARKLEAAGLQCLWAG